jgi:tetratricopeptide (TPR) repeat protein
VKFLLFALVAGVLSACGAPRGIEAYGNRERSPTALAAALVEEANLARAALDSGDASSARSRLADLCIKAPHDLGLAAMLQDAELAAGEDPSALRARYLALARERDDADSLVLAARLEPTPAEARSILERAVDRDPKHAWARYGLAFVQARDGAWGEAKVHLKQALELDRAHLPARRLEAALLARDGKFDDARTAYSAWLEASRTDPRVDPQARLAAELDLALVELESGRVKAARARLAAMPESPDATGVAGRRLCLIAATEQALGHPQLAYSAAQEAEAVDPRSALPMVQQALLNGQTLNDPAAARAAWERVLSGARSSGDLGDLIQSMRARVVLERLDQAAALRGSP